MPATVFASPRLDDARVNLTRTEPPGVEGESSEARPADWSLQRNCSLAPAALAAVFCALASVSAAVAVFFWIQGAVLVLPFAVIEVLALGVAFVWYARHATDGERLWLSGSNLVLEVERAGRVQREVLDTTWLEVRLPGPADSALGLRAGDRNWRLGQHVSSGRRARVAGELKRALRETQRA